MGVFVVPDNQMPNRPRYGEEVPRRDWQQNLEALIGAIEGHRAKQGPYQPVPAGTPTFRAQESEREAQAQALRDALTQRVQVAGLTGIDPETGQSTWDRQRQGMALAQSGAATGPKTQTERSRNATANLIQAATDPQFQNLNRALDFLQSSEVMTEAARDAVDMRAVVEAAIRKHTGRTLEQFFQSKDYHPVFHAWLDQFKAKEKDEKQDLLQMLLGQALE
jgi:hypothetical protein